MYIRLYPEYYQSIQNPMDLQTIKTNIKKSKYSTLNEAYNDIRQIFINCHKSNKKNSEIRNWATSLSEFFEKLTEVNS
jgi:protein polybromo-1